MAAGQKRKGNRGDWAESALVLRRSTDGGATWGSEQTLCERAGYSVFNGNLVEDRQTGQVLATCIAFPTKEGADWFLKTWIPAGGGFELLRSRDDGQNWSLPEPHIPAPNADGWHGCYTDRSNVNRKNLNNFEPSPIAKPVDQQASTDGSKRN